MSGKHKALLCLLGSLTSNSDEYPQRQKALTYAAPPSAVDLFAESGIALVTSFAVIPVARWISAFGARGSNRLVT